MSTILTDNFTDSDSTALTSHTPDSGGSWSMAIDTSPVITSNVLHGGAGYGYAVHSAAATTDPEEVVISDAGPYGGKYGAIMRASSASSWSWYMAWIQCPGNAIQIWRRNNGSFTLLKDSDTWGYGGTTPFTYKMTVSGTGASVVISVYIDDVLKSTYTDTDANRIVTPGQFGLFMDAGSYGSTSRLTSLVASDGASEAPPDYYRSPFLVNRAPVNLRRILGV